MESEADEIKYKHIRKKKETKTPSTTVYRVTRTRGCRGPYFSMAFLNGVGVRGVMQSSDLWLGVTKLKGKIEREHNQSDFDNGVGNREVVNTFI